MKKEKCSLCKGEGQISDGVTQERNGLSIEVFSRCPKCNGSPHLDWIEQVVGKQPGHRLSPGITVKEVDLSAIIPSKSLTEMLDEGYELCDGKESTTDLRDCFQFEHPDDIKEFFEDKDD